MGSQKKQLNFNQDMLNFIVIRDGCQIEGTYQHLNSATTIQFRCGVDSCEKVASKRFSNFYRRGGFCKKCTFSKGAEKTKQTSLLKYGVSNPAKSDAIKAKIENTVLAKYGVKMALQNKEIREKGIATMQKRYGVDNPFQAEKVKQHIKEKNRLLHGVEYNTQRKDVQEKTKRTCIEKYGVSNPMKNKAVREKGMATNMVKYGAENPFQSEDIKQQIKEQNIILYGVEHNTQRQMVKDKIQSTCLRKYGVKSTTQVPEIFERCMKRAYRYKQFTFPCGNVVDVQGYEPYALDLLTICDYTYDDITIKQKGIPPIWYHVDNKRKRYFPDIYIKKENTIIEVKSDYTWKVDRQKCELVKSVCEKQGIKFCVWVFNKNGEMVEWF